jgi:AraC-like DNA-binding protein
VPAGQIDYRLRNAIATLECEPPYCWRVEHLRALSGLSASRFRELFVSSYGCSPRVHLTEMRMNRAVELLTVSQRSVKETAAILGVDVSHFVRDFRQRFAMTPAKFKQDVCSR